MEEEIDLRQYINTLLKYKFWIVGLTLVATVVGLGVSFLIPPTYEAAALVAITEPRYTMQFDPRMSTDEVQPPYNAYPDLAMGDALLFALIQDLGDTLDAQDRSVRAVSEMLKATNGSDPSIVRLQATNGNPEQTALIADRWAQLFVDHVNELYGQSKADLVFFDEQLAEAKETLAQAEQDLIDFQAKNESAIFQAQLDDKQAALEMYLEAARTTTLFIQDAKSLRTRLSMQDAADQVSLGDELTTLLLAIPDRGENGLPIELQISGPSLSSKTVGEQFELLDTLIQGLQIKLETMTQEAQDVEPDLLALQESLEQSKTQDDRLTLAKTVAQETVLTLSRKVAESRIAAQNEGGDVRLASSAVAPDEPASPRKMINTAVAGALGLLVGIFGAFAIEYWREEQSETPA